MKIDPKVHTQRAGELKSKAQEELDAAGGEKIAAKRAKADSVQFRDEYQQAKVAGHELLNEAAKLRADAAEKMKQALGSRGQHAMANVVRGFASMMNKLAGQKLETTVSVRQDPDAKATAERMQALAAQKEAAAQEKFKLANNSWAKSIEAVAKMEGHERTAATHMEAAGKLMKQAAREQQLASWAQTVQNIGASVRSGIDGLVDGAKAEGRKIVDGAKAEGRKIVDGAKVEGKKILDEVKVEGRKILDDVKVEGRKVLDDVKVQGRQGLRDLLLAGAKILTEAAERLAEADKPAPQKNASPPPTKASAGPVLSREEQQKIIELAKRKESKPPMTTASERQAIADLFKDATRKLTDAEMKALDELFAKNKPPATKQFEPGKVEFGGGGPRAEVKLPNGPAIDAPPRGEKRISESLLASRFAAEAVGVDWTKFDSHGELKKELEKHGNPLKLKHGDSPFKVKQEIAKRLGLKDPKNLDVEVMRDQFARRDAMGLSRLLPRAEFESILAKNGLKPDSPIDQIAMTSIAMRQQLVASAAKDLKASDFKDPTAHKAFAENAQRLDTAKGVMLEVLKAMPREDRRTLALDTCDALEHAHGKPAATTKLAHAAETLSASGLFMGAMKKALDVDDKALDAAMPTVLRALEWVSLGEMKSSSTALAYPGPLTDEQKKVHIFPLASRGVELAKELELLDDKGLATLRDHMSFKGGESISAQLLGVMRQVAAMSERRDFRTKELLTGSEVLDELRKNATKTPPSLNPAFIDALAPIIDDVVKALR